MSVFCFWEVYSLWFGRASCLFDSRLGRKQRRALLCKASGADSLGVRFVRVQKSSQLVFIVFRARAHLAKSTGSMWECAQCKKSRFIVLGTRFCVAVCALWRDTREKSLLRRRNWLTDRWQLCSWVNVLVWNPLRKKSCPNLILTWILEREF